MFSAGTASSVAAMAANVLVAFAFQRSARAKWDNPGDFALYLGRFRWPLLPRAIGTRGLAYAVIAAETVLALTFAWGRGDPYREWLALLMLAAFTVFLLGRRDETRDEGCACFGEGSRLNRHPVARNLVLAGLVLVPVALGTNLTAKQSLLQAILFLLAGSLDIGAGMLRQRKNRLPVVPPEAGDRPALFLSYRFLKEADRVLSPPAARPIAVILEAPPWIFEAKRERWASHLVLAASAPLQADAPFVLARDRKGRVKRYGEWAAFVENHRE